MFGKENKKKEPLINRIKYDGPNDGSDWLVYKYPSENLVLGSQLIVNQGQEALFFKGGQALDLFGPGRHVLSTGNLPLLNKLVNLPFCGDTPFTAEIYYINKTDKLNMNWGTQNAFPVEDPKYGVLLSIRSHGTYGIHVYDTRMFITALIGAVPHGTIVTYEFIASYFSGLLVSRIKKVISRYMIREKISFLEVTVYLDDISRDCKESVDEEFERFGTEVVNFFVETISPPKEEYEQLRKYKEELSLGEEFYTHRRSLDIMEGLAENDGAGGLANVGAGLGMGLGFAGQAGSMFQNMSGAMNVLPNGMPSTPNKSDGNICPNCGNNNQVEQKFCGNCGVKLVKECPSCGKENTMSQKFCGDCGTSL